MKLGSPLGKKTTGTFLATKKAKAIKNNAIVPNNKCTGRQPFNAQRNRFS